MRARPGAVVRVRADVALDGAEVEDKGARARRGPPAVRYPAVGCAAARSRRICAGEGEQVYPIHVRRGAGRTARGTKPRPAARRRESPSSRTRSRRCSQRLALRVAGRSHRRLRGARKLARRPPAAIRAALRADGGELREQAIRIAGERKLRDEVPALLDLLDNPNEAMRDAALGALIEIGDRRAVTALAKSRSLHDRREMRKIIEAIATLGGDEALDYLSFVAAEPRRRGDPRAGRRGQAAPGTPQQASADKPR